MQSSDHRRKTTGWLNGSRKWRFHILINLVFAALVLVQWVSLDRYWSETLQPRLQLSAETQSAVLARSQTTVLVEILTHTEPQYLRQSLYNAIQEMLVVADLSTGKQMISGVSLIVDEQELGVPVGSLNIHEGQLDCDNCFYHSETLISRSGVLLGVADFVIRDDFYRLISADMKSRLFRESAVVLVLLLFVWGTMLVVFHRLHNAKRLIEASDRAKTRFLANVTHELRTPLNGILGYTQIFKAEPELMSQHGKGIQAIDRCADHLLQLINDILEFSRADEDRINIAPQEMHLVNCLQVLVEINRLNAFSKGLDFVCDFPRRLPAQVWADEKRIRQVVLNLLSNAVKFTSEGRVRFTIQVLDPKVNKITLRFLVADTGMGMAEQDLNKIFVPFQQLDNAVTRSEGSGLGLSISAKLVRLMGSRLKVSSVLGSGSCFWFDMTFPVLDPETVDTADVVEQEVSAQEQGASQSALPEMERLQALLQAARSHNILALRQCLNELESNSGLEGFVQQCRHFADQYRFKELAQWLEEQQVMSQSGSE